MPASAHAPTGERILAAALLQVAAEGHEGLSMRKVGQAVGTTAMAIYRHYRDREHLLDAVADAASHRLEAALSTAVRGAERAGSPAERLASLFAAYVEFGLAEPRLFDLVFLTRRRGVRRFPGDFAREGSRAFRQARLDVEACMDAGLLRRDDALETTLDLWAHTHGLVTLYRVGRFSTGPAAFRELAQRSLRRHLAALAPPGAGPYRPA